MPRTQETEAEDTAGRELALKLAEFRRAYTGKLTAFFATLESARDRLSIDAALTGHVVLSTLHTNDAPSSRGRLVELGVSPFVLASSVVLVCAQRLVRQLCGACEVPAPIPEAWTVGEDTSATFFSPRGCEACENSATGDASGCTNCSSPLKKCATSWQRRMPAPEC